MVKIVLLYSFSFFVTSSLTFAQIGLFSNIASIDSYNSVINSNKNPLDPKNKDKSINDIFYIGENEEYLPPQYFINNQPIDSKYAYHVIKRGDTISSILKKYSSDNNLINDIFKSTKNLFNLKKVKSGNLIRIKVQDNKLLRIQYVIDFSNYLEVSILNKRVNSKIVKIFPEKIYAAYSGSINGSLIDSFAEKELPVKLALDFTQIFEFNIDFAIEVKKNDTYSFIVEKFFIKDKFIGFGKIVGANIVNDKVKYQGYFYGDNKKYSGYFNEKGKSLKKFFLKSPLQFSRISSGFSLRRFHPVLKEYKPHYGIDYVAPVGTPIRTIGPGRVVFSGYSGRCGNMVKVKHNNTYETAYCHLSSIARKIRRGSVLDTGDVVGRLGGTGVVTGPHLHFAMYKNGAYVNALNISLPAANVIPKKMFGNFKTFVSKLDSLLESNTSEKIIGKLLF